MLPGERSHQAMRELPRRAEKKNDFARPDGWSFRSFTSDDLMRKPFFA
jgi:hypothetical protein